MNVTLASGVTTVDTLQNDYVPIENHRLQFGELKGFTLTNSSEDNVWNPGMASRGLGVLATRLCNLYDLTPNGQNAEFAGSSLTVYADTQTSWPLRYTFHMVIQGYSLEFELDLGDNNIPTLS